MKEGGRIDQHEGETRQGYEVEVGVDIGSDSSQHATKGIHVPPTGLNGLWFFLTGSMNLHRVPRTPIDCMEERDRAGAAAE